jgi:hypothetical protein
LCALGFALSVRGHAAAQSRFNFASNKSFAYPPAIKENFIDESRLNVSLKKLSKPCSEIDAPVVIITGDLDQNVSTKDDVYRLKAAIANARSITLKDTGHGIPQTHPESIYNALSLITSPIKVSDVSRGEVRGVVREVSLRYALLDQAYEFGRLKPFTFEDDRSDQSINHQLTSQRRFSKWLKINATQQPSLDQARAPAHGACVCQALSWARAARTRSRSSPACGASSPTPTW